MYIRERESYIVAVPIHNGPRIPPYIILLCAYIYGTKSVCMGNITQKKRRFS